MLQFRGQRCAFWPLYTRAKQQASFYVCVCVYTLVFMLIHVCLCVFVVVVVCVVIVVFDMREARACISGEFASACAIHTNPLIYGSADWCKFPQKIEPLMENTIFWTRARAWTSLCLG